MYCLLIFGNQTSPMSKKNLSTLIGQVKQRLLYFIYSSCSMNIPIFKPYTLDHASILQLKGLHVDKIKLWSSLVLVIS